MIELISKILFFLGSFIALLAGITEIYEAKKRQQKKVKQNVLTPALLMTVKFILIPYYWIKVSKLGLNPFTDANIISKFIGGIIWFIATCIAANIL